MSSRNTNKRRVLRPKVTQKQWAKLGALLRRAAQEEGISLLLSKIVSTTPPPASSLPARLRRDLEHLTGVVLDNSASRKRPSSKSSARSRSTPARSRAWRK